MTTTTKPKAAYWIIALIALIWNGIGVNAYLQQQYNTEAFREQYATPEQLEMAQAAPIWYTAAFAVAVFGGLFGSFALLLTKKIASLLFSISLLGILVQLIYDFLIIDSLEIHGSGALIMPVMIVVIGIFLFTYSKKSIIKGWLN